VRRGSNKPPIRGAAGGSPPLDTCLNVRRSVFGHYHPGSTVGISFLVLHDHDGCPSPSRLNFKDSDVSPSLTRRATPAPTSQRGTSWTLSGRRTACWQNGFRSGLNVRTVRNLIGLPPVGGKPLGYSRELLLILRVHQISLREAPIVATNKGRLSGFGEFGKFGCVFSIALCRVQGVGHRALPLLPPTTFLR
jgi:hypothetical protein